MAKIQHKSYNQNDSLLFPPCLGDFIEDNDPVCDIVPSPLIVESMV